MVTSSAPASAIFSCWTTASSNVQPLAIDCATAPLTPDRLQFRPRGAKDRLRSAEAVEQLIRGSGSQTWDEFERQPVKFLIPADDRRMQSTTTLTEGGAGQVAVITIGQ